MLLWVGVRVCCGVWCVLCVVEIDFFLLRVFWIRVYIFCIVGFLKLLRYLCI